MAGDVVRGRFIVISFVHLQVIFEVPCKFDRFLHVSGLPGPGTTMGLMAGRKKVSDGFTALIELG